MENKKIGVPRVLYLLKRINSLVLKNNRILFFVFTFLLIISNASPLLQNFYFGKIINFLSKTSFTVDNNFIVIVLLSLIFRFLPLILRDIENYIETVISVKLVNIFDLVKIDKRMSLDLAILEDRKFNDLFQNIAEKGGGMYSGFVNRQFYLIAHAFTIISPFIVLASLNFLLALIILVSIIPRVLIEYRYSQNIYTKIAVKYAEERRKQQHHYQNFLSSKVLETRIYDLSDFFKRKIIKLLDILFNSQIIEEKKRIKLAMLSNILSMGVFAFVILYYLWQAVEGRILIGNVVFVISAVTTLQTSASWFFGMLGRQFQDAIMIDDFVKYLDLENILNKPLNPCSLNENTPCIEFKNVSFKYPDTENLILENINLKIDGGEKVAIVGINGAGKTTLIKLLCRFYDPNAGEILIDGENIKNINIDHFYKKIGILFQDFAKHLAITIKEAIYIGEVSKRVNMQNIENSVRKVCFDCKEFKLGYDSRLGKSYKDGVELSGGQWQKLALAKVFYRDPQIYILDEPTASVDAQSEAEIFEELDKLPEDRTVIFVSHRFSTVRRADRIIVIDNGKIAETGSHKELMSLEDGIYRRLFNIQAREYIRG